MAHRDSSQKADKGTRFRLGLTFSAGILVAIFAANLGAQEGGRTPPDGGAVERGKGLYSANCSFCHGSQGGGSAQAPSLIRNPLVNRDRNGDVLGPIIRDGRPTKGMPAFSAIAPEAVLDIIAFLRSRSRESRGILPETALLVGDALSGQTYFNSAGKCNSCHSPSGDLAGIGTKYGPLALTVAFLTPTTQKPITATVRLASGENVEGTLQYEDEFLVSVTDGSGEFHSWPRDRVKTVDIVDPLAAHKQQLARYTDTDIHNLLAYLVTLK